MWAEEVGMKTEPTASPPEGSSAGLLGAVVRDITTGALHVDVSEAAPNLDRSFNGLARGVVLVCSGTHSKDACPMDAPAPCDHGVIFETDEHATGERCVHQFSQLARADHGLTSEHESVAGGSPGPRCCA